MRKLAIKLKFQIPLVKGDPCTNNSCDDYIGSVGSCKSNPKKQRKSRKGGKSKKQRKSRKQRKNQ
jgi:hypothetical protein